MQHLELTYSDILIMPTCERRFYLSLLLKSRTEQQENAKNIKTNSGKGKRTTTISGEALKGKLKNGEIPFE